MMYARCLISAFAIATALNATAHAQDNSLLPYGELAVPPAETVIQVNPRTVQLLDEAIAAEKDLPRKTLLVRDLGLCPVPESTAVLKRLLADPEPLVRAEAVRSLFSLGTADEATLQPLASDASAVVQRELVRAKFAPAIVAGVRADDPTVRAAAVSVSVNDATDRAIADQLDRVDPPTQAIAVRTIADRKYAAASPAIAKLLASESIVARIAAIEALAKLGSITRPQIDDQLKHAHSAVRVAATRAASVLESVDRVAIARASLADKDLAVRAEAAKLDVAGDASFLDTYFAQLPLGYEPLRLAVRDALVRIAEANAQAQPTVTAGAAARLADADAARRIDGSYVLGALRSKEGLANHIKLLTDADWRVVEQAARSLGPVGDASAGDELVKTALRAANDQTPTDVDQATERSRAGEQAVLSAVMLKHTPVVAATKSFYGSKTAMAGVRNASIYAAGVLGEPEETARALRPLLGRINDPEESPQAIIEAIRALGNLRAKSAVGALEKLRDGETSVDYQYAAHVSLDRINNTQTPFKRSPETRTPETHIRALDPR